MSHSSIDPFPPTEPAVPPPAEPVPPVEEPEPDRLPDETPDPNPDENDAPPIYSADELKTVYGLSRHDAERKIKRFGPDKSTLDLILGSRRRTQSHRRQDIDRNLRQVTFG